jgi:heptosyltransferase-2
MRLAVFLPNWVGDAVMTTPALRALRAHFAGAHIIGVVRPYVAGVLEGAPWFDSVIHLDKHGLWRNGWLSVVSQLRREKLDLAILFPNSVRTALVAWLSRCGQRVGFDRYGRGWLLTDRLKPVCDAHDRIVPSPLIDAYNRLAQRVGCPTPGYRMELFTTRRDEAAADTVWRQLALHDHAEVICLNPGAAFGSAKHWPSEYFVRLAQELVERRDSAVLVLCGPNERQLAAKIAAQAQRRSVHSLADQPLSLGLTKACIRRANLLVTTDSGPRHFAAAFERPVVTLFGPTHIAWTETFYGKAIHLQKKVPCGPCQKRTCPTDHRCMKLLEPAEVFAAVAELLSPEEEKVRYSA